ncbi:hypothetical protein ACF1CY_000765 [Providencia rettgeri]
MIEFLTLMWGYIIMGVALGFGLTLGGIAAIGFHLFSNAAATVFLERLYYPLHDKYRLWRLNK